MNEWHGILIRPIRPASNRVVVVIDGNYKLFEHYTKDGSESVLLPNLTDTLLGVLYIPTKRQT